MPKKPKTKIKILRKPKKVREGINVNIKIDNSRKTTARRQQQTARDPKMQPFVNFPQHQPARQIITEVKPNNYNSPDLNKTMDEYQKQFKTYMETNDQNLKDMILKFDDTLKKNTAPPRQQPQPETPPQPRKGAYNRYEDYDGNLFLEESAKKTNNSPVKRYSVDDNNLNVGYTRWNNTNAIKAITIMEDSPNEYKNNEILNAEPINTANLIRAAPREERQIAKKEIREVDLEENKKEAYKRYKSIWEKLHPDQEFPFDITKYNTAHWTIQGNRLEKTLMKNENRNTPKKFKTPKIIDSSKTLFQQK